jgi:aspartyl/asparaginyl beta-hydroxylase (cupin superfamily)
MSDTLKQLARACYELACDVQGLGLGDDAATELSTRALLGELTAVRAELAAKRVTHLALQRRKLAIDADSRSLKLHLGCGEHHLDGWINLDVAPAPFEWNVQWGLPFADAAATHVLVSHLLEHLYFPNDAGAFLCEVLRVLAPGGKVRLIVPDVAQLIAAYQRQDRAFFQARAKHWQGARGDGPLLAQFLGYAGAGPDPGFLFEAHKYGYDFETLSALLQQCGFTDIKQSAYMASADLAFRHDDASEVAQAQHAGGHYSLFVEAAKPAQIKSSASPPAAAEDQTQRMQAARSALSRGQPAEALKILRALHAEVPKDAQVARSLGVLALDAGALEEAEAAFKRALEVMPQLAAARLHLGRIYAMRGHREAAVAAYLRAITHAQMEGQWLDEASTPPQLRGHVLTAMELVARERVPVLQQLFEPLLRRYGADDLQRLRKGFEHYLGVALHPPPDARQAPLFFHIPELKPRPWLEVERLPWIAELEADCEAIAAEAQALEDSKLAPFLEHQAGTDLEPYLGGGAKARWDAHFFYRHGRVFESHLAAAPATAAALKRAPLVTIPGQAPEICFSVLAPGTQIKPHHGVTNARVVVHLPLIVPAGCTLTVADETRSFERGRAWVFDDTFLHEANNPSSEQRVILLMDAWNPELQPEECQAFCDLVEGIARFNQGEWGG